ncbi:MAG: type I restriction enzyme endonuclease domain-containing protein [Verrucomicrobiota bacterium]
MIIDYYGVVTQLHDALELYGALDGKFDAEDLEGALSDIAGELRELPNRHAVVWAIFADINNRKDEEAFELVLEDEEVRDRFYTALSRFNRTLKLALSSLRWIEETPEPDIARYKQDAIFFQRLRASVKLRFAEEVDYREYEKQIEKMLNTYVQADELVQVIDPVNIFEREAFEAEVDKARTPRAKADTIANRMKKTITERMDEDPFFYRKFSVLIQQAIDDYKAQRISEAEYLRKMIETMEEMRKGGASDTPNDLRERDLAQVFHTTIKATLGDASGKSPGAIKESSLTYGVPPADWFADAACRVEDIVRAHAIVGWRDNPDAQNRMRNDIDDYLFELQHTHGLEWSLDQMDEFIETTLRVARNRPRDV